VSSSATRHEYDRDVDEEDDEWRTRRGVKRERRNGTIRNGGASSLGKRKRMFNGRRRIRPECETETIGRIVELFATVKSLLVT